MAEQNGEKIFDPSPRKLQKARNRGQLPRSQELVNAATLLALMGSLWALGHWLLTGFETVIRDGLTADAGVFDSIESFDRYCRGILWDALVLTLPFLGVLLVVGIAGTLALGGSTFSPEALRLRWESLNPAQNLGRLFEFRSVLQLIQSTVKILLLSLIVGLYLKDKMTLLTSLQWSGTEEILGVLGRLTMGLCLRVGIVLIVLALGDVLYQRWKYFTDMKMTREEVKQEQKDTEGSPQVRARQRQIAIQRLNQSVKKAVPTADVVLVNPTHYAVAIKYDGRTMEAPVVVAKGVDQVAQKIRELARAYGVPIVRRPELARTLFATVKINQAIPEGLYMAVAEVLAMLHRIRQQKRAARAMG